MRVSTDSKDQENSFDNQKHISKKFPKSQLWACWNLCRQRVDTTNTNREEFLRMIQDAGLDIDKYKYLHLNKEKNMNKFIYYPDRRPLFNRIFVKNTSRLPETLTSLICLGSWDKKKCLWIFWTFPKQQKTGPILFLLSCWLYLTKIAETSPKGEIWATGGDEKGVIGVNKRLYGYEVIDKYTLEIIPKEAEVIRYIYDL